MAGKGGTLGSDTNLQLTRAEPVLALLQGVTMGTLFSLQGEKGDSSMGYRYFCVG